MIYITLQWIIIAVGFVVIGLILVSNKINSKKLSREVDEHLKSNSLDPPDSTCLFEVIEDTFWGKLRGFYKIVAKDENGNVVWTSYDKLIVGNLRKLKELKSQDKWADTPFVLDLNATREICCAIGTIETVLDLGGSEYYLENLKEKFVIKHMTEA